jgi:hypothetical protein
MQIYLDDERPTPEGYRRVYNVFELIGHIIYYDDITEISLDHDLGLDTLTGYDFCNWLEKQQYEYGIKYNFKLKIHSANPIGRKKMETVIKRLGYS